MCVWLEIKFGMFCDSAFVLHVFDLSCRRWCTAQRYGSQRQVSLPTHSFKVSLNILHKPGTDKTRNLEFLTQCQLSIPLNCLNPRWVKLATKKAASRWQVRQRREGILHPWAWPWGMRGRSRWDGDMDKECSFQTPLQFECARFHENEEGIGSVQILRGCSRQVLRPTFRSKQPIF